MSPKIFSLEEKNAREQEMLNGAKQIIITEGEVALSIDKLVSKLPYSKGTFYNHFTCKEDIILAISTEHVEKLAHLFTRALSFNGNSREKALAIHVGSVLHSRANPEDFMIGVSVKTASCSSKASPLRHQQHLEAERLLLSPIFAHYRQAVDSGECLLPEGMGVEQLAFTSYSIDFGTQLLLMGENEHCSIRSQLNAERELLNSINLIHDGMCWQPLTKDFDWRGSVERIKKEIFAAELAQINNLETL